jgi:Asp/Glu/hydantoin racemase
MKIPPTTDRVTRSMTKIGNVKALVVKSTRLKVKNVLKTQHSAKWIEAINTEVDSLINNFKCLIPEEINYGKDYDCIHATIDHDSIWSTETLSPG